MSSPLVTSRPVGERLADPDRLLDIRDVAALGYAHPVTIRRWLGDGTLRGVKVGGKWKVRAGDLPRPAAPTSDLDAIADEIVATFPPLTPEQRAEIGRLLNSRLQQPSAA